jgi:hypothetical protein
MIKKLRNQPYAEQGTRYSVCAYKHYQHLQYLLGDVRFRAVKIYISPLHSVQTSSGTHTNSYPVVTRVPSQAKSGEDMKLTTHLYIVSRSRMVQLHFHSHITSPWRSAYLIKYRDNFAFLPLTTSCCFFFLKLQLEAVR